MAHEERCAVAAVVTDGEERGDEGQRGRAGGRRVKGGGGAAGRGRGEERAAAG